MARHARRVRANQIILQFRPMRPDDDRVNFHLVRHPDDLIVHGASHDVLIALAFLGIVLYYVVVALEKVFAGWAERQPT